VRIALDEQIFAIQEYGGISRMFASLASCFAQEPDLGVDLEPFDAPVVSHYVLHDAQLATALGAAPARHVGTALLRYFTRPRPRSRVDVVHNTFYLPHGLAGYPGAKRVVTIHDMIPERLPQTRRRLDFITMKHRYVMKADHIVCVSEATRKDLLQIYPDITAPVSVIHHGVDPRFSPDAPRVPHLPLDYVLFVGNRGQYKDAKTLIEAFARIHGRFPDLELAFVGGGKFSSSERAQFKEWGIEDRVHQYALTDVQMRGAYAHATAFVFPSQLEGFGMPALEAMASGTPTILANTSSLPEVGGEAAVYFSKGSIAELADALQSVLDDVNVRVDLHHRGIARARDFTWRAAARMHADVYRNVKRTTTTQDM
jgi:glycosyltransferase involved in cell wall biosynthesis